MKYRVGIVGAGIAGLAAAIRLSLKGHQVEVFEANAYPGGKLSEIRCGAYRFDAGPSLLTLPELIDELFVLAGEDPKQHFAYDRLEVNCHYFYPDGTRLLAHSDENEFLKEVAAKTQENPKNVKKAIEKSRALYDSLSDLFMYSSLQDLRTFFGKKAFKAYGNLHRLGFSQTMNGANRQLFRDQRMVQLFNRYATYNGSSPYETPATMNIIPHLEMSLGAYFPKGGMHAITQSLYELALRCGVTFHFETPIDRILVKNKKTRGLMINNEEVPFDRVVSNMDVVNTYRKLMPEIRPPKFLLKQPKSSSALIFYWGIKKQFSELGLHNIFFSGNYLEEFEHIFQKGSIYSDPTVYVHISSKYESEDAPDNSESWFTMINVPNNQGQNWDDLIAMARENILKKLSQSLKVDVQGLIEVEEVLDPRTIESRTSSAQGALYGNSSNNLFAAFLRHANVSRRVSGLYFCGGSVHPGGGIPMSLSSAKLVAQYFR